MFVIDTSTTNEFDLFKARGAHKYIKRTGTTGNYKYWYKNAAGNLVAHEDEDAHAGAKIEHLKRLIAGKIRGAHSMSEAEMGAHVGIDREKVGQHSRNMRRPTNRSAAAYSEHELHEAKHGDVNSEEYGNKVARITETSERSGSSEATEARPRARRSSTSSRGRSRTTTSEPAATSRPASEATTTSPAKPTEAERKKAKEKELIEKLARFGVNLRGGADPAATTATPAPATKTPAGAVGARVEGRTVEVMGGGQVRLKDIEGVGATGYKIGRDIATDKFRIIAGTGKVLPSEYATRREAKQYGPIVALKETGASEATPTAANEYVDAGMTQEMANEVENGIAISTQGEVQGERVGDIGRYREDMRTEIKAKILENARNNLFTVGFKYLEVADEPSYEESLASLGFRRVSTTELQGSDGMIFTHGEGGRGGYTNLTGPANETRAMLDRILGAATYVKDVSPYYDGLAGQPSAEALAAARGGARNKPRTGLSPVMQEALDRETQRQLNGLQIPVTELNNLSRRARDVFMNTGVDHVEAVATAINEFKDRGIIRSSEQRARAAVAAAHAVLSSEENHELAQVSPELGAHDREIQKMVEMQAQGKNPYVARAKQFYSRIKGDMTQKRRDTIDSFLAALSIAGQGVTQNAIKEAYMAERARTGKGEAWSKAVGEIEGGLFHEIGELISNEPINVEVERMKRGFGKMQYERLKNYLSPTFHVNNPQAPPPYPTYDDLKSWEEHGERPAWANKKNPDGSPSGHAHTSKAVPKEFHDSMPKDPTTGKVMNPPSWLPLHMTPVWNYVASKGGSDAYKQSSVNSNEYNPQSQKLTFASQGQLASHLKNSLRRYVQMRGESEFVDMPKSKLDESGVDIKKLYKASDADLQKLLSTKLIPMEDFIKFLKQQSKIKKSIVFVVNQDSPVTFKKSFTISDSMKKSELIARIKSLKSSRIHK